MSKRKRKRQPRPDSAGSPAKSGAKDSPKPADLVRPTKSPKRSQTGLLVMALCLLAAAVAVNWRRSQQNRMPEPLPFPTETIASQPLKPASGDGQSTRFISLDPQQTGVTFAHPVDPDHPQSYLYFSSMASGGTAIGDVNGDGRPDLFVASGPLENRLYVQQEKPFTFANVTTEAGVGGGDVWSCGATMVDINADGRLDIYVANYDAPNQLFINYGDGRFQDRAFEYGLNITNASLEGVFSDYDRDGDLDLYLVTYRYENPAGMPLEPPIERVAGKPTIRKDFAKYYEITNDAIGYGVVGRSDGLLRNDGNGVFHDVTEASGIHGAGHGQSATWWDFNDDGFPDLFVGNDFNDPDQLYRNNGNGTFTDVIRSAVPHTTWFSMGSDAGDVDGDGLPDLLTSDMSSTTHFKQKTTMGSMGKNREFLERAVPRQYMRNALLLNSGTSRFREAAYLTGLDSTDWTWAVKLIDANCDGRLDAFFTNGSARSFTDSDRSLTLAQRQGKTEWDIYKDTQPLQERDLAFRNEGGLKFTNVSQQWGIDHLGVSMSSAHGDFDGDGDLDLVVANLDEPLSIYRNDTQEHRRLTVRLHGGAQNRYAIGAKLELQTVAGKQVRELQPSRGFLASNQPLVHFGCGDSLEANLKITWPDGGISEFPSLKTNRHYSIADQSNQTTAKRSVAAPAAVATQPQTPLFARHDLSAELGHVENEFDDYQLQPLLPHRMSRLGPALACADFAGDAKFEYFLGGAAGQPGQILAVDSNGALRSLPQPALEADRAAEDMGAIWLDVDNDQDQDLLVASGGNEFAADSDLYRLRLYLNDGGHLTRSTDRLPDIRVSAGPLAAADFDQDGDVDVFVGGRQVPGKYPLPANSFLLVNDGGVFSDKTSELASGLAESGMVTGALWSDVDDDQDLDLLLTTEWDHLKLFKNSNGKLTDNSAAAGLTGYRGWWTGVSSGDFDGDGDLDFVATNLGLNTKYHASDERPFQIYYGDFEGTGTRSLVEAEYEHETLFPIRGKGCSTHAMPSLASKFPSYKSFAAASLQEIYTPQCLDEAYRVSANWLHTSLLTNDGKGNFSVTPLPTDAQISPGFGTVVSDLNGDGHLDILIAQNFFSPQPETGNMDGGLGCLLLGRGDGTFRTTGARDSGIILPEDATAACLTDFDGDAAPDLIVATNNGHLVLHGSTQKDSVTTVTFSGVQSISEIAGTKVTIFRDDELLHAIELSSGSGYLSQQPPVFAVPTPADAGRLRIQIRWPNGDKTRLQPQQLDRITIQLPGDA